MRTPYQNHALVYTSQLTVHVDSDLYSEAPYSGQGLRPVAVHGDCDFEKVGMHACYLESVHLSSKPSTVDVSYKKAPQILRPYTLNPKPETTTKHCQRAVRRLILLAPETDQHGKGLPAKACLPGNYGLVQQGDVVPKGSILRVKGVPIYLLQGPSISHIPTRTLWGRTPD